ncbi:hypothetical protein NPX13_g5052 [Xylaria arbuscula]|uniref:Uncharacterized protein n=1 Tax=Xylaria arbuscula TaxID=114810 RepID=A0A9W8TLM8_9PEZI|nr:hypothetical protein NPX13_g5052 [Xylaria arbuscula]
MVYIPPNFEPATVPEDEAYEGTELDDAVKAGSFLTRKQVYTAEKAERMALGEYEGSKALYASLPDNIPRPIAAGPLANNSRRHCYELTVPTVADWAK